MHSDLMWIIAGIVVGGVVAQWLGWRLRTPSIVFLLVGGLVAGPITGVLDPDETFGSQLFPMVSLAVALILFEGALGLGWKGVRVAGWTIWSLLTIGASVTLIGTALAASLVLGVDRNLSMLLAATLVVTGPTVVGPVVRSIGLHGRVGALLEAEGTLIDPIGAVATVLVFEALYAAPGGVLDVVGAVGTTFAIGVGSGVIAAVLLVVAFHRFLVPDELHTVATLATVLLVFVGANEVRDEAGLVAVTAMGIALASQRRVPVQHVLAFNVTLRTILISALFVLLGARIQADTLREIEWRNIAFLAVLVVLVRPVSVLLATCRSNLARNERLFLAATAPRGIVAAAIASVFSLHLAEIGVEDSQILVSVTFTVIAGTVLLAGFGSRPLAARLGLIAERRDRIVVLGANPLAQGVAEALEANGVPVRLIDLDRRQLTAARMSGLDAHRGSVFSDETWESTGLRDATFFLALTSSDEINTLAASRAAAVLGRGRVFQIPPGRPEHRAWWDLPTGTFGRPLFTADVPFETLERRFREGRIGATHLTAEFGFDEYASLHPDALVLFTVNAAGDVAVCAGDRPHRPTTGDLVIALKNG